MKLHAMKFGLACAGSFSITWIVCSLLVMMMPKAMLLMSGHMVHGDFTNMQWNMGFSGLVIGLICWAGVAGLMGFVVVTIYNKLCR